MIETARLLLRPWRDMDLEAFWAMACDRAVMRYMPPLSRARCEKLVERMTVMQAEHGHCLWALERKTDGRFIGFCGIIPPVSPTFEYEIGWRLASDAWGQGYAREAAEASLDWAWRRLITPAIVAITTRENARSWGLMERLGMTRCPDEDFKHPGIAKNDPLRPHVLYRIHRPR
ncbi:MAG: GNAT family N-acetyltransferase [Novosphingobium sp.]|nr:GNAT family N-acetyltransferase [Novosphingobium sp.]